MGSLGAPEILVILVVALLVLGPDRLPEAARQAGRFIAEARRMSAGFQAEIRDAMQTPVAGPPIPPSPSPGVEPAPPSGAAADGQRFRWDELPPT
jgi:TatA/E family protein of Tat protein translocase